MGKRRLGRDPTCWGSTLVNHRSGWCVYTAFVVLVEQNYVPNVSRNTWKQHPQLSSQGLGDTTNNQVSRFPGEEHACSASVFRKVDVPWLLLHLFFELSITQLVHASALLFFLCSACENGARVLHLYSFPHPRTPTWTPPSCTFIASIKFRTIS